MKISVPIPNTKAPARLVGIKVAAFWESEFGGVREIIYRDYAVDGEQISEDSSLTEKEFLFGPP